jgi:UDP-glucose 4-epimerase
LRQIEDNSFKVVILRPPMIYGKGSKGNYPKLSKAAQRLPIFPDFDNTRSMLHIDNLCEFIRLMIDNEESGLFFPQNREYVKTSEMVRIIAQVHGKEIRLTKIFNKPLKIMEKHITLIEKVFGNMAYKQELSNYRADYRIRNFKESIRLTESK